MKMRSQNAESKKPVTAPDPLRAYHCSQARGGSFATWPASHLSILWNTHCILVHQESSTATRAPDTNFWMTICYVLVAKRPRCYGGDDDRFEDSLESVAADRIRRDERREESLFL